MFVSDAQRPCSTCVRSHAYALAHASPNDRLNLPEQPECTFDDGMWPTLDFFQLNTGLIRLVTIVPPPQPAPPAPKSRYERLENRISKSRAPSSLTLANSLLDELENLLREKASHTSRSPSTGHDNPSPQPSLVVNGDFGILPDSTGSPSLSGSYDGAAWSRAYFPHTGRGDSLDQAGPQSFSGSLDQLAGVASLMQSTSSIERASISSPSSSHDYSGGSPSAPGDIVVGGTFSVVTSHEDQSTSMLYMSWPPNLPDISTTRHLYVYFYSLSIFVRNVANTQH